jgi:sterol desaturase/sphingolipid hydroxylase (fatty acid hydroxylase superfamily)
MALSLGAATGALQAGFSLPLVAAAVAVGHLLVVVALEQCLPREPGANLLRDRQSLNDLAHGVFVGRPIATGLSAFALAQVAAAWPGAKGLGWWPSILPLAAQLGLALLVWSFGYYWLHRAFHAFDALWWFHSIHHDTPQLHVLKSLRLHVGEQLIQLLVLPVPLLLLGAPVETLVWLGLWNFFDGNLQHSNLDQRFPDWAHYVLPTVQLHRVHHATERELHDHNFTGTFPLWDLVFGTFRHPLRNPVHAIGLSERYVPGGFLGQMLFPFEAVRRPRGVGAKTAHSRSARP